jgi:lipoprotein-anchoring transpeptidase ErfK/SrfK
VPRPGCLRTVTLSALALLAGAGIATAADPAPPTPVADVAPQAAATAPVVAPPSDSVAWTAHMLRPVMGRAAPSPSARPVAPVTLWTHFTRRPQVLLVTAAATGPQGGQWVRVLLPRRPNGSGAWIPSSAVQLSTTGVRLRIRTASHRVEVWRDGRLSASYPAAVGTGNTPTPIGLFAIQDPVPSNDHQRSYLGPYILTLTAHSAVLREFMGGDGLVAIHGTNAPGLLGQSVSHGCVRVSNETVVALHRIAVPGTPVEIVRS